MPAQLPADVVQLARRHTAAPVEHWWIRDIKKSFDWLRTVEIYWIIEGASTSIIAIKPNGATTFCSNCSSDNDELSKLIDASVGSEPWMVVGKNRFAKSLAELMGDPRLEVTTPSFISAQLPMVSSWLMATERSPKTFKDCQMEPSLNVAENSWTMTFKVFNYNGGVDLWTVSGYKAPFSISNRSVQVILPDGTFSYPLEL